MKTLYAGCLSRLGLSQVEAAAFHSVRLDTVKNWSSGRSVVPDGAWDELRAYEARIIDRSEALREAWEDAGEMRDIDLTVTDDVGIMAAADFLLGNSANPPVRIKALRRVD